MLRNQLLDDGDRWIGWVQTDAGLAGGWHHHGDRDSYVYILRGAVTIGSGPEGRDRLSAEAGDLVFNPARVIHRESRHRVSRRSASPFASAPVR